jgi:DNA-directed RNA polymerase specialized sigma24 family protein
LRPVAIFPATDWERLELLTHGAETDKPAIIGELFVRYRQPIMAFLRRKGFDVESAEDLVQDFFLYRLDDHVFERADETRGRFRNLMLKALTFFAAKQHRHRTAQMRAPEGGFTSIQRPLGGGEPPPLPAADATPEAAFERDWAQALVARVLDELQREMANDGLAVHFDIFKRRLIDPLMGDASESSNPALARAHGLTEKEVSNRLVTAKRAYQRRLRAEIATYARDEDEVDDEIRELFHVLAS